MFCSIGRLVVGLSLGAGLIAVQAHAKTAPDPTPSLPPPLAGPASPDIRIEAPHTRVEIDSKTGQSLVRAPGTVVAIDPESGRLYVNAPSFKLDLSCCR